MKRLLLPWLIWSLVYAAYEGVKFCSLEVLLPQGFLDALTGPSMHLWYLPFLFCMLFCVDLLLILLGREATSIVAGVLGLIYIGATGWWRPASLSMPTPLPQYAHALAGSFVGLAMAGLNQIELRFKLVFLFAYLLALFWCLLNGFAGVAIPYAIGISLIFVATQTNFKNIRVPHYILSLAPCTFGVYLVHPFVIAGVRHFFGAVGFLQILLIVVLSFLLVFLIKKTAPRLSKYALQV